MGIATGSLISLMFRVSDVFIWGFIGVLTARTLSVEERGVYATAIVLTSAIGGISSFSSATGFFVSNQKRDPAEVAANALLMALPIAFLIMAVALAASFVLSGSDGRVVVLTILATAPAVIRNTSLGVVLGQNSILKYNFAGDVAVILALVFISVWVGILGHRSAESALQAWCLAQFLSLVPIVVWARSWWRWALSHRPNTALMRRMVGFSAVTGLGSIVGILNYRVDQVLVIQLDGKAGAGIYSSAIAVAEGLWLFSSAITLASFASVGRGDPREAARLTATGIRHTVLVVICGGLSAALFGPFVVEFLFGAAYQGATGPIRILSLGTALFAPQGLINLYFVNHRGRPSFPLYIGMLSVTISVIAGTLLIPRFGTAGAAWATTISYGIASAVSVSFFLRNARVPASELWRVRRSDLVAYLDLAAHVLSRGLTLVRKPRAVVPVDGT